MQIRYLFSHTSNTNEKIGWAAGYKWAFVSNKEPIHGGVLCPHVRLVSELSLFPVLSLRAAVHVVPDFTDQRHTRHFINWWLDIPPFGYPIEHYDEVMRAHGLSS